MKMLNVIILLDRAMVGTTIFKLGSRLTLGEDFNYKYQGLAIKSMSNI